MRERESRSVSNRVADEPSLKTSGQPFLTPVPANSPPTLLQVVQPLLYSLAVLRLLSCVMVLAEHVALQTAALLFVRNRFPTASIFQCLTSLFSTQYVPYIAFYHG